MRRKRLLPKPEPPPEGYMFWYNNIVPIPKFENKMRSFYDVSRRFQPNWRDDPTYHMKINKRRKQDAV